MECSFDRSTSNDRTHSQGTNDRFQETQQKLGLLQQNPIDKGCRKCTTRRHCCTNGNCGHSPKLRERNIRHADIHSPYVPRNKNTANTTLCFCHVLFCSLYTQGRQHSHCEDWHFLLGERRKKPKTMQLVFCTRFELRARVKQTQ